ncbi:hypothetical protein Pan216_21760 [Planctomycetes bacterium Pan216]|uniref:Uncharacterized protein n=1 Tax=Kolteria novifilia TaxID=2527975 RepID=A0A518B2V6_9BACT|nr:hypothetical protein Pan216_21760 [Planctomycetes bacterium Pan216]
MRAPLVIQLAPVMHQTSWPHTCSIEATIGIVTLQHPSRFERKVDRNRNS